MTRLVVLQSCFRHKMFVTKLTSFVILDPFRWINCCNNRRMHTASARPGQWMCFVGACQEKPRSFLNHHQQEKHQQDHANVNCPECNQLFSAKRNLKRHVRIKHKTVEANISRNSNESNPDENFNPDDTDIHNVAFQMGS